MADRPILFAGELVRAILDGRKTQTRRLVNHRRVGFIGGAGERDNPAEWGFADADGCWHVLDRKAPAWTGSGVPHDSYRLACPHGEVGDRLWVRESWWHYKSAELEQAGFVGGTVTLLDSGPAHFHANEKFDPARYAIWRKRPSIHMPRWASRITIEITGVRVERLQAISNGDALAEGVAPLQMDHGDARLRFEGLWDSLNGKRAPWSSNPWVWVLEFRKLEASNA